MNLPPWAITLLIIGALAPLEYFFPRVSGRPSIKGRLVAILGIGAAGLLTLSLLNGQLQPWLVPMFLQFKLMSFSKLELPSPILFVLGFLLIDLMQYTMHLVSHKVTLLWRMHAIHHADEHVTAASSLLHHPLEIITIYGIILCLYVILGMPILIIAAYGLANAFHSVFCHANIALPAKLDTALRLAIVTPDMHRTHHSIRMDEGNSNFGQIFTIWDRLFGTYVAHPTTGEAALVMGLPDGERPKSFSLAGLLLLPFARR
jgi:sterol desaturase/sphingolipid hydroxylase (fatty acid hydroxylase superfamily)